VTADRLNGRVATGSRGRLYYREHDCKAHLQGAETATRGGLRALQARAAGMVIGCEVGTRARRGHRPRRRPGRDHGRGHACVDGI